MKIIRKILLWINFGLVFFTLLSYFSPFLNPDIFWPVSILGFMYPYLLIANIAFIVLWLFIKLRYSLFSIVCILLGWNFLTGIIGFHSAQIVKDEQTLSVMSYNVRYLYDLSDQKGDQKVYAENRFKKDIRKYKPNILCAQESGAYARRIITGTHIFPHHTENVEKGGTIIFSRYPIINEGVIDFGVPTISCSWADIAIKKDTIRVYSFHFQSNQISAAEINQIDTRELNNPETWNNLAQVFQKYKIHSGKRVMQVSNVRDHIDNSPYPVILAGDLNDIPQSYAYRTLSMNLCDNFKEQGTGIGKTFRSDIPALRIDYIFSDPAFRVADHKIPNFKYSDHYPIFSTLVLP